MEQPQLRSRAEFVIPSQTDKIVGIITVAVSFLVGFITLLLTGSLEIIPMANTGYILFAAAFFSLLFGLYLIFCGKHYVSLIKDGSTCTIKSHSGFFSLPVTVDCSGDNIHIVFQSKEVTEYGRTRLGTFTRLVTYFEVSVIKDSGEEIINVNKSASLSKALAETLAKYLKCDLEIIYHNNPHKMILHCEELDKPFYQRAKENSAFLEPPVSSQVPEGLEICPSKNGMGRKYTWFLRANFPVVEWLLGTLGSFVFTGFTGILFFAILVTFTKGSLFQCLEQSFQPWLIVLLVFSCCALAVFMRSYYILEVEHSKLKLTFFFAGLIQFTNSMNIDSLEDIFVIFTTQSLYTRVALLSDESKIILKTRESDIAKYLLSDLQHYIVNSH